MPEPIIVITLMMSFPCKVYFLKLLFYKIHPKLLKSKHPAAAGSFQLPDKFIRGQIKIPLEGMRKTLNIVKTAK